MYKFFLNMSKVTTNANDSSSNACRQLDLPVYFLVDIMNVKNRKRLKAACTTWPFFKLYADWPMLERCLNRDWQNSMRAPIRGLDISRF